jgi:hypothetical protein
MWRVRPVPGRPILVRYAVRDGRTGRMASRHPPGFLKGCDYFE